MRNDHVRPYKRLAAGALIFVDPFEGRDRFVQQHGGEAVVHYMPSAVGLLGCRGGARGEREEKSNQRKGDRAEHVLRFQRRGSRSLPAATREQLHPFTTLSFFGLSAPRKADRNLFF
jgi:hypothetical protein